MTEPAPVSIAPVCVGWSRAASATRLVCALSLLWAAACSKGATSPGAQSPDQPGEGTSSPAAAPAGADGGQQQISERDSVAEGAAPRPEMSASAREAYQAGLRAFGVGDLAGAKAQFLAASQADDKAYQAHYSLGVVEERLGAPAAAMSAYRKALDVVPDYERAAAAYGILLARQGEPDRAVTDLKTRLGRLPSSATLTAALAEVKSIQGESGEAQRLAQEALKKDTDYRPAMVTLARDHFRHRRLDLALYTLKGILDGYGPENPPRDKNNAEARLLRGLIYRERNLRGPAIEELSRAVEIRPDLVEARLQLATYMLEAGNAEGALPHLEAAVRYDNKNVLARLNLGDAYRLLDRPADARRELEWVLKAAPNRPEVHYNLGLLYLLSKDMPGVTATQAADRAIDHLEQYKARGVRGGPDDAEELITRAKTRKALLDAQAQESKAAQAKETP
jgi:Tfp pilus assembly protein PilF